MIIYNVTVNVENDIVKEWVHWMRTQHIPEVLSTGLFLGHKFLRLLNEEENNTGTTFAIQYQASTLDHLQSYLDNHAQRLQEAHTAKYRGKFVAFRTFLEAI
jgi:hypothetical protein